MKIETEEIDETIVTLDTYNSDLNLVIDSSCYLAQPLTTEGFALMWAGARATHGSSSGKFCYEVKIGEHLDVSHLPADEPNPHVIRLGFSVESSSLQLGEDELSYGYGGTGKISTNSQFKDYGSPFKCGDVILALANMDSEQMQIGFAKNGAFLGWAYRINKSELKGQALFPHVLTKNTAFDVNFGQMEIPYFPLPDIVRNYNFIGCLPLEKRTSGTRAPKKRGDCEMIMMCGLPGAGKSFWAGEYLKKHPGQKYNVLGTNTIIDKMKVMGLSRKRNYSGRWDVLIQLATKCLNKMFEIGAKLQRNYILDQTNVYPSAQRRKMRNFEGFKRIAVVVLPTNAEYKRRCNKRDQEEGKDIPDSAVNEMKANFKLPEIGDVFEDVIYTELPRKEAEKLVAQYNDEGRAATHPPRKQFRPFSSKYEHPREFDSPRGNVAGRGTFSPHGGFDSSKGVSNDRGGFRGGHGGFDGNRGGRGNFDGNRGGFNGKRGGFDGNRGSFTSGHSGNRGAFNSGRGGFDGDRGRFSGGRGGFDGNHGGFGNGRGNLDGNGRGNLDGNGRGNLDSNRAKFDGSRGGRGGFDGNRGGRGSFDGNRGGRGGFDGNRGGRGGLDGNRGGYSGGYEGGYAETNYGGNSGGFDSGHGSFNTSHGGRESYGNKGRVDDGPPRFDRSQDAGNSSGGYRASSQDNFANNFRGFGARASDRGRGDFRYGSDNSNPYSTSNLGQEPALSAYDRSASTGRGQQGFRGSSWDAQRGGFSRGGNSSLRGDNWKNTADKYGSGYQNYEHRSGDYKSESDPYSGTGTSSYGMGSQGAFKKEHGTERLGASATVPQGVRASGKVSRWSAEVPQVSSYPDAVPSASDNVKSYANYGSQVRTEPPANYAANYGGHAKPGPPTSDVNDPRYGSYSHRSNVSYSSYLPPSQSNPGFGSSISANTTSQFAGTQARTGNVQDRPGTQYYQPQSQPNQYFNQYYRQ